MRESEGEKEHVDRHKLKLFGGQRDRKARKTNEKEERKKNDLQLQFGSIFPATRFAQSKFRNFFRELWILKFFGSSTWYKAIFPAYVLVFRDWHPPPFLLKK
jgi:hypothetical protein